MGPFRHALAVVLSLALFLGAGRDACAEEPQLVLVAPAHDTPEARRAASELATALVAVASVEESDVLADPAAVLSMRKTVRVIVVIDATPGSYSLRAFASDGRTWAPRPVARVGPDAVVSEHVSSAGRSIVTALLASAPPPVAPAAPPSPSAEAPPVLAQAPVVDAVPKSVEPAPAFLRIEGGATGANVGPELPFHPGVGIGAWWLRAPVHVGALYTFYPGAVVDRAATSFLLTRHVVAAGARAELRFSRWEIDGSVGPLLEVWARSTRGVAAAATAAPSSTFVTAGAFGRVGGTFWVLSAVGVSAGAGLELSPGSPRFQDAAGADVLSPNVLRARADVGLAGEFR